MSIVLHQAQGRPRALDASSARVRTIALLKSRRAGIQMDRAGPSASPIRLTAIMPIEVSVFLDRAET
jgi:hypothetical protein